MSNKEEVSTEDVKRITKFVAFIVKNWHVITVVVSCIVTCVAWGYNQYNEIAAIEKYHKPEQEIAKRYYKKIDSIEIELNNIRSKSDIRNFYDSTCINNLYFYKMPYGKYGNVK